MTADLLIQSLADIGVRLLPEDGGGLRVVGPASIVTAAMKADLRDRKAEILEALQRGRGLPAGALDPHYSPLIENGRRVRWLTADEVGLPKCRTCGAPIRFWKIETDTANLDRGRWFITDPDNMRHACGDPNARYINTDNESV